MNFIMPRKKNQISFRSFQKTFFPILLSMAVFTGPKADAQHRWREVWADHFNGRDLSSETWTAETGTGNNGWGNQELQYYTASENNLQVRDGELRIIARKQPAGDRAFTSARIKTQNKKNWKYGRVEAKIRLPKGKGFWPAFWMLGDNIAQKGWPFCGEIDVMEHVNEVPEINGTMHWDSSGRKYHGGTYLLPKPEAFHLYAIEWDKEKITWLVDEIPYHEELIGKQRSSRSEFHHPYFILLNLAVGGDWPGSPDETTVFPDTMHVDYVRVLSAESPKIREKAASIPSGKERKRRVPAAGQARRPEAILKAE